MAVLRPFAAIRPKDGMADKIAALPYDVYNRSEAKDAVKDKPHSFLRIDRAETTLPDDVDTYDKKVYERAKELLAEQIKKGEFIKEENPCFYLYELVMNGRSQTGIVGCASIDDYTEGVIKKHENTRADKEEDRIRHVDTLNAQTGPIFLAYRDREDLRRLTDEVKKSKPLYDFTSEDGITHRVYKIDDTDKLQEISEIFQSMGSLYIADGHHRCASAVKVGLRKRAANPDYTGDEDFNYFLSVLFADEELMIMDYNRVVKDLNGMTETEFLDKLKEIFDISETGAKCHKPEKKGQISMLLGDTWYILEAKPEIRSNHPVDGLDVAILQNHVLSPMLGIEDPKTDKRIDFVGGIRGIEGLEKRVKTDSVVAFAMYPTSIHELFAVADAGLLMPPKSTWFEPKLRSGLFIHQIGEDN